MTYGDRAEKLLEGLEAFDERLAALTPDERLQMSVAGGFTSANADKRYTLDLATAYALVAIAKTLERRRGGE